MSKEMSALLMQIKELQEKIKKLSVPTHPGGWWETDLLFKVAVDQKSGDLHCTKAEIGYLGAAVRTAITVWGKDPKDAKVLDALTRAWRAFGDKDANEEVSDA